MEVKIVIPSHKRAGNLHTLELVPSAIVCIPLSQKDEYRRAHPDAELVTHPDAVLGLQAKRNWMYQHFGDMFQLDDDLTDFRRMYLPPDELISVQPSRIPLIINETAYCAKQAGAFLFGYTSAPNPTMYKATNPIRLTGWINGCAQGLLRGSKLWWSTQIKCNCDYWISALNAHHHRIIWKDTRFAFMQKGTFTAAGGQAEFRNLDAEEADYNLLKAAFGDAITLKRDGVLAKRKHQFQKTLKLPF